MGVRSRRLWFGVLGGMFAWVGHLGASYVLIPWVCATGSEWTLHALTGLLAAVAALATVSAARSWRRSGREARPSSHGREDPRGVPVESAELERFLGLFGVLLSGFFLVLILVGGMPALLVPAPCAAIPTLDQPIVMLGQSWLAAGPPILALQHGLVAPGGVWRAWNPDPWILATILTLTGSYLTGVWGLWREAGRGRGLSPWRVIAYVAGVSALLVALVSPVAPLGATLFSVHMVQHMLLMVVAAPLIVLGRPVIAYLWVLPRPQRRALGLWSLHSAPFRVGWGVVSHPVTVLALHVTVLWLWHVPTLYQAALASHLVHTVEHASYLISALLFWWALARSGRLGRWPGYGAGVLYVFGAALQSGALGALLLFARTPWYPAHALGAELWGIDLLVDQQLAGALMWIPAGLVYTAAMLVLFLAWVRKARLRVMRRERYGWDLLRR